MPNWCENDVWIHGPKELLDQIAEFLKTEDTLFDFNKVCPYPEDFAEMDRAARESDERIKALTPEEREVARKKDPASLIRPKDGFNSGGYEWCLLNWGTKWNTRDVFFKRNEKSLLYKFATAWSPPLLVMGALSRCFPQVKVTIKYYEAGMGFQGKHVFLGGVVRSHLESDYHGQRGG